MHERPPQNRPMSRAHWLELGLTALSEGGPGAITLDALTARAGRTRGSFYHHFRDQEDFIAGVLSAWRERSFLSPGGETPFDALDPALETAVRRLTGAQAAEIVAAVDAARIRQLRDLHAAPASPAAADYAEIFYAVYLGLLTLDGGAPDRAGALLSLTGEMIEAHWNE